MFQLATLFQVDVFVSVERGVYNEIEESVVQVYQNIGNSWWTVWIEKIYTCFLSDFLWTCGLIISNGFSYDPILLLIYIDFVVRRYFIFIHRSSEV